MGCSVGRGYRSAMALWGGGRGSQDETDARTKLERKLYLARESPEPDFDLSGCGLRRVPAGVYSVCRVLRKERLLLQDNCLKNLDGGGALADLHLLTVLNISVNKFSNVSSDIALLLNLRDLDLSHNVLTHLPECLGDLTNLVSLNVSLNSLKQLPKSLGRLRRLRVLRLRDNPNMTTLPSELCGASNLVDVQLDAERFICPPAELAREGTARIMMFLCDLAGVKYEPPAQTSPEPALVHSPNYLERTFQNELQIELDSQKAAAFAEKEKHAAAECQREKFLYVILKEQRELDAEISKIQNDREAERLKLVGEIQEEERCVAAMVDSLMHAGNRQPEALQQQLEHERAEHDRLIALCRDNYHRICTADVLEAMRNTLEEQATAHRALRTYEDSLDNVMRVTLLRELNLSDQLEEVLKAKDANHFSLVQQLLHDESVQKAAVASLLERVDVHSWSLQQEISMIASNLAKLSVIEQEKRRLEVHFNYELLLHQRMQLLELLDDLFQQQSRRRGQLVQTLKDMESAADYTTDFWLSNYQRLLDSAPKTLLDAGRSLDPTLANHLLQEGVIHCLPFLVKFIFTDSMCDITEEDLTEIGVNLSGDRQSILRAIKSYMESKTKFSEVKVDGFRPSAPDLFEPSAPLLCEVVQVAEKYEREKKGIVAEADSNITECVICMDARCEVVFTPCGHLCCCMHCANNQGPTCPMCRFTIEKKLRVIIP